MQCMVFVCVIWSFDEMGLREQVILSDKGNRETEQIINIGKVIIFWNRDGRMFYVKDYRLCFFISKNIRDIRRKCNRQFSVAEVVQYAKDHYDLVEINPAATNWIERQKNLKASLIMQHKPELLGQRKDIPKPDFHNEESVKNFLNEMEIRNKLIDQMPDNVIPMDFHLYEIKIGEDLMEIEVDYTWNIFGISYSGNKSVIKRFKKIARDLYCYYGVSEEDIKNRTKRYSSLVTELSS